MGNVHSIVERGRPMTLAAAAPNVAALPANLEAFIGTERRRADVVGIAVAAFDRDGLRFAGGLGYADLARGERVTPRRSFGPPPSPSSSPPPSSSRRSRPGESAWTIPSIRIWTHAPESSTGKAHPLTMSPSGTSSPTPPACPSPGAAWSPARSPTSFL